MNTLVKVPNLKSLLNSSTQLISKKKTTCYLFKAHKSNIKHNAFYKMNK